MKFQLESLYNLILSLDTFFFFFVLLLNPNEKHFGDSSHPPVYLRSKVYRTLATPSDMAVGNPTQESYRCG